MSDTQPSNTPAAVSNGHITEDEASLYDRQIRLWGLAAQNRMRSSTILILSLRSLAHETIKNLVLAGIGRLIIMDDGVVTDEDLGSGFLFREEDGAVGKLRTEAALPQIASLNPLVQLSSYPTISPFVNSSSSGSEAEMIDFLKREKVDVVVSCDLTRGQMEAIDSAAHKAGTKFYGAGTYGFYGFVFADLGEDYSFLYTPPTIPNQPSSSPIKKSVKYTPLSSALDPIKWGEGSKTVGGSPFRGLSKRMTAGQSPQVVLGILSYSAVWEFENRRTKLPSGLEGEESELLSIAEGLRDGLGIREDAVKSTLEGTIQHLASHAQNTFPPTLAILGGLLAQDVLRALSEKDTPIINLLTVDSLGGTGCVARWGVGEVV